MPAKGMRKRVSNLKAASDGDGPRDLVLKPAKRAGRVVKWNASQVSGFAHVTGCCLGSGLLTSHPPLHTESHSHPRKIDRVSTRHHQARLQLAP
jgi:hypothetical protein